MGRVVTPPSLPSRATLTIMSDLDLTKLSVQELIALHRSSLRELYDRGIIRTMNSPQGDYGERLVAEAYDGELAPNSEKSWDVVTEAGDRIQVKSRVFDTARSASTRQMSVIRSWDFDTLVVILFSNEDLSITQAVEFETAVIKEHARYVKHVNGWRLVATAQIMALGQDITVDLQRAALAL